MMNVDQSLRRIAVLMHIVWIPSGVSRVHACQVMLATDSRALVSTSDVCKHVWWVVVYRRRLCSCNACVGKSLAKTPCSVFGVVIIVSFRISRARFHGRGAVSWSGGGRTIRWPNTKPGLVVVFAVCQVFIKRSAINQSVLEDLSQHIEQ